VKLGLAALLVSAAALAAPAAAQVHSAEQTLLGAVVAQIISGSWEADPVETREADRDSHRCDQQPEVIRVSETDDGLLFEYQRGNLDGAAVLTSGIRFLTAAIWIQYDQEWRTTPEGDPVEWFLFMPDENHFFWVQRDRVNGDRFNRTPMRRHCPAGPVS
jgi:hypothetical protein